MATQRTAPTHAAMFVLLGMLTLFQAAHAEETGESILHNDDALAELSVVRNWTQICEQLCSLNLSGPACGLDCPSTEIPHEIQQQPQAEIHEYNFPSEHRSELCETLCDNGLGGTRCTCLVNILPAASPFHSLPTRIDRNKICFDFCRFHHFTLRGCSQCPHEGQYYQPLRSHDFNLPPQPVIELNSNKQEGFSVDVTDPPTPDWNRLCVSLCRQGTGGILCNCDLAPF